MPAQTFTYLRVAGIAIARASIYASTKFPIATIVASITGPSLLGTAQLICTERCLREFYSDLSDQLHGSTRKLTDFVAANVNP